MPAPLVSPHPMPIISIATPASRDMTFTSTKGLLNGPGQNNCFLNSAVQVLWHLDIFRRSFRDLSGHACMVDSCIFCALKELFSQLQFSNETALPPDALRRALAESFFDQQRFQLGFMDDAAECFENMLMRIHMHIAHGEAEDMCNARHCIPHQKFAMTLVEQSVCGSCGATSEPLSYTQMVHYVSTSTLVYQVRMNPNRGQGVEPFGQLLRKAGGMGDVRVCPSACGAVIQIGRTLMNRPEIVSIGLVWNSERPTLEHIMEVFSTIGTTLRLSDVFNKVVDNRWAETCCHNLVGIVTYYGKHYSTFFFHTKLRVWIYFDDATVREVGPKWEQVVEKCRKGRYQPLLLLYASPDGTPVNTENAPKQVTSYNKTLLRRSITPNPEKTMNVGNNNARRAITPNPDGSHPSTLKPRPYNDYQNLAVIQRNLKIDSCVDGRKSPLNFGPNLKPNVQRTSSNGSSSGVDACFRDYLNVPRTRDSGNWSSDRNSSSSSENPYLYMIKGNDNTGINNGGGCLRAESSSSNDIGYDSYSLSSNDSSTMTTIQHLMKMGHLAKIPEDYNNTTQPAAQQQVVSCDVLCDEADELLVKSRQLEDDHDLVLALALCNAAATKARAAMDAPYNNPQTLTLARMKHNTCIMRARSLHRRMTQNGQNGGKDNTLPEIRHTREGSSGSGKHSRQSSRDKGQHSRQNSRELLVATATTPPIKNIEIYATLPKKKMAAPVDDYVIYDKPPGRESRSIFSRGRNKEAKRSRSDDRNKNVGDFSIAPEISVDKKEKEGKGKKQHKIRRKLMGGLIRRKNRSMPDLTDNEQLSLTKTSVTVDDSGVGLKENPTNMCGYLSEGHLEFTGTNVNLERSKLMRKSFHGSAGKILIVAKVPPPPPLRTSSQLTTSKSNGDDCHYNHGYSSCDGGRFDSPDSKMVVTRADVHHEQSPPTLFDTYNNLQNDEDDGGIDEVDCLPPPPNLDLPPYPSPLGSAVHSRQASEEFPPPPPPLDLSALDEHLPPTPGTLLAQLQNKRQEILSQDVARQSYDLPKSSGDDWLKELQAKQAALRLKKNQNGGSTDDCGNKRSPDEEEMSKSSTTVKDLANKFENIQVQPLEVRSMNVEKSLYAGRGGGVVPPEQIAEEIREVEMIQKTMEEAKKMNRCGKKKSVSFCDQVILVAATEEQEDDSYARNPLLEKILKYAAKDGPAKQEILPLKQPEIPSTPLPPLPPNNNNNNNNEEWIYNDQQAVYASWRRNSVENLLSRQNSFTTTDSDGNYLHGDPCQQMRQSPYQRIPQNSPIYMRGRPPAVQMTQSPQHYPPAPSPLPFHYNYQQQQYQQNHPIGGYHQRQYSPYQHPPEPSVSPYQKPPTPPDYIQQYPPYQQVPHQQQYHHVLPPNQQNGSLQRSNGLLDYRVPPLHGDGEYVQKPYPVYKQVVGATLNNKQFVKKSVSFEAGTKGGTESPLPKAVVTPIIVNNANNSVPGGKTKCNLCRKKAVVSSNLYCTDCEFYMSRFKPKR